MSDDLARMLYEGAVAVKEGRHADAQGLLLKVIEYDEQNELAWLWLSGAMEDPADQQVALENVLSLNPNNVIARQGLAYLTEQHGLPMPAAPATKQSGEWVPPPPQSADEVEELACYQCGASVYSVASFCWQCHAPIHCCMNCRFLPVARCKELQGLTNTMSQAARNDCEWWRAHGA
jgi:hypothetical protein